MILSDFVPILRPFLWFDTETTGPNPSQDRIVEIGFRLFRPDATEKRWRQLVDPGIPIPHQATHGFGDYPGHGITDEMVAGQPTFGQLAPSLLRGFRDTDYGGYNIKAYDLPLMRAEFERNGHVWSYSDARILDVYKLWQLGQKRTLSDAVAMFLGREHDGAHGAMSDVEASIEVCVEMLRRFTKLPKTLDQLHDLQWPRDPNAIDDEGKFIWKNGVATVNFGKKWKDTPMHKVERGFFKWMTDPAQSFSPDTKRIAQEAYEGRLPRKEITSE